MSPTLIDESHPGYRETYAAAGGTRLVSAEEEDVVLTVLNMSANLSVEVWPFCSCGVDVPDDGFVRGRQQLHFPPERHLQGFNRASTTPRVSAHVIGNRRKEHTFSDLGFHCFFPVARQRM